MMQNPPTSPDGKIDVRAFYDWLILLGLEGVEQEAILNAYCEKLVEINVPVARLHLSHRTHHPKYGGIGYSWIRDRGTSRERYEHAQETPLQWLQSPLYHLLSTDTEEILVDLRVPNFHSEFPLLNDLHEEGYSTYLATGLLFEEGSIQPAQNEDDIPQGMLISWAARGATGFTDAHLTLLRDSLPLLGLALKSASNRQMGFDLLQVYLGQDAGRRVMSGEIQRGSLQQIDAVIWNFDLEGFTGLSERLPGADIIEILNDYLGVAVDVVEKHGGSVLKFMGDGIMAMFDVGAIRQDAKAALDASCELQDKIAAKNIEREATGRPVLNYTLALHAGEILYGNIGAESRLDFTVIGPAVNQTARMAGLHKSLGQRVILSDDVAKAAQPVEQDLVSLGRYMLRGIGEPKELFTLYRKPA